MDNTLSALTCAVQEAISSHKDWLTSLDAAIGDGDHGINMARGFEAVTAKIAGLPAETTPAALLKTIGMTLISTVGGASGPLYGTAFLRAAGEAPQEYAPPDAQTVQAMLGAALQGIKDRGKAVSGEKTMLDALEPAYQAFTEALEQNRPLSECLEAACGAASQGVEYTKTIAATKGRASYLGERSIGHQDPGASSCYLILRTITDFTKKNAEVS
ncbi:hypothetical protein P22_0424 [Propionispora sp. 2/2-37]|uniref:dihydroxyacetone kinase subunit DhaL n=1 Tax=Propionispora sp. 2/2-37 TaxID=1677858 RepID=UPI0006BB5A74|nr:dihydroxyacetone kinase subunit DhaL [Propionispora sp. 2/2-37]CUH94358.1 hypothetical protein P22_0424 [Propionispora sp. 2/2-37]